MKGTRESAFKALSALGVEFILSLLVSWLCHASIPCCMVPPWQSAKADYYGGCGLALGLNHIRTSTDLGSLGFCPRCSLW